MSYENVKLWFAKDNNGEIVTIDEINKDNAYSCPICGSDLKAKAVKSKLVTPHFAHLDASKCNSETMIHWWFKHKFLEKGDKFTVVSDKEMTYECKEVLPEQSYQVKNGIYRPDVTILTECGEIIYFEMAFTNKKSVKDYLDSWIELGNIVVEIDIKDLMLKNELLKFKALYYEGKCFNIKRNDTYYNTIGKYKEEKFKRNVDESVKERIKKLDWFWEDMFKYKKGEVNIEHMTLLIDSIDDKEKEIAFKILSKKKCNEIYRDYLNYKQDYIYKILQNKFDFNSENYSISKSGFLTSWYDKYETKKIEFRNNIEKEYRGFDIRKNSVEEISEMIKERIVSIEREIKHKKDLQFAKQNDVLNQVIKEIDLELKQIDERYNFYNRFVYSNFVTLYYNRVQKIDFRIEQDIIYSQDSSYIKKYFFKKIDKYLLSIKPFEHKDFIVDILNKLNSYFTGIKYFKKVIIKRKPLKEEYQEFECELKYNFLDQDLIEIEVSNGRHFNMEWINKKIYIYQNKVISAKSYVEANIEVEFKDAKIIKILNNESDWRVLEALLINEISELLINSFDQNCIDCNEDFKLDNGEFNFFIYNKLTIPKRCKSCREKRKRGVSVIAK